MMHVFVMDAVNYSLEHNAATRHMIGQLFHRLASKQQLSEKQMEQG